MRGSARTLPAPSAGLTANPHRYLPRRRRRPLTTMKPRPPRPPARRSAPAPELGSQALGMWFKGSPPRSPHRDPPKALQPIFRTEETLQGEALLTHCLGS